MSTMKGVEAPWFDVHVARRWHAADDIVVFELVSASAQCLPAFAPGACVDVLIPGGWVRTYSLCNPPSDGGRYLIAVLRERKGGGGSRALHEQVSVGDVLPVRGPFHGFELNPSAVHSVLVAGGIGIAPLLSMAASLWQKGAPFDLHYSARHAMKAAFAQQLLNGPFSSRVRCRWTEACGHVDFGRLLSLFPHNADVYACGPMKFTESIVAAHVAAGRPNCRLHTERFDLIRDGRARR
jgi:vanillate O-demethylase ferredoxin subunit